MKYLLLSLKLVFLCCLSSVQAKTPWNKDYFPNIELTRHDGVKHKFFDDLIEDKIVVINFIYTSCPDMCPLETAQLTRVQKILGDKVGKDLHFYSISIDPERDTSEVLSTYRKRFKATWDFYTGNENEIIHLRKKLGLYLDDSAVTENKTNHNVSMVIGNQKTGRWMQRSPFENPYVLAEQLANWLTEWKVIDNKDSYANAPKLRKMSDGERLFRTRCQSCHTIDGSEHKMIGPDLLGVTHSRELQWLVNWLKAPDKMIEQGDPIAVALYKQYNEIMMPNLRLTQTDIQNLLTYMQHETERQQVEIATASRSNSDQLAPSEDDAIAVMNAWVREPPYPEAETLAGYMTMLNPHSKPLVLSNIESPDFDKIEIHHMTDIEGKMSMTPITPLILSANGSTTLKPGGKHLMFFHPKKALKTGDRVSLTLTFDSGQQQRIQLPVKAR